MGTLRGGAPHRSAPQGGDLTRSWRLRRARDGVSLDDHRFKEISTHEEVVKVRFLPDDDQFECFVRTETAVQALCRRRGFFVAEVLENVTADAIAVPEDGERAEPTGPIAPPHAWRRLPVRREPEGGHVDPEGRAWAAWRYRVRPELPRRQSGARALSMCRQPTVDGVLRLAASVATRAAREEKERLAEGLGIVLTVTGWGLREQNALLDVLEIAQDLGPSVRVALVRNDLGGEWGVEDWARTLPAVPHLLVAATVNDGFAAACNSGAALLPNATRILFTQADCRWDGSAVLLAAALSEALAAEPTGFGRPAVVGPSGGRVDDVASGQVSEVGRAVGFAGPRGDPRPVDWVTGYWLMVDGPTFRRIGGWDPGFFLYMEDPDLCLRMALAGCRPVVWPDLEVDHDRSSTCRRMFPRHLIDAIQQESRTRFVARWATP